MIISFTMIVSYVMTVFIISFVMTVYFASIVFIDKYSSYQ